MVEKDEKKGDERKTHLIKTRHSHWEDLLSPFPIVSILEIPLDAIGSLSDLPSDS